MKTRSICCIVSAVISFFSLTSLAGAAVPWITQSYEAYAAAGEWLIDDCEADGACDIQSSYGPPLSISASAYYSYYNGSAYSEISATTMSISASVDGIQMVRAYASAGFIGNYIADDNYFVFSYDGFMQSYPAGSYLTVNNVTTSTQLFSSNTDGSGTYYIPTTVGDEIGVSFGINLGEVTRSSYSGSRSLTYSMSTAVAPEPISSILFVTGGTLLAGRRYIKRKKKA